MTTPFHDLDDFIALPRLSGLALNPEGTRLVTTVATLNEDKTKYTTALWEVDPSGDQQSRRLTHGLTGETAPVFTSAGDLLFTSSREATTKEDDDSKPRLWCLPAAGGEAHMLAELPGGISSVVCARDVEELMIKAKFLPAATNEAQDRELRDQRKELKVDAILHAGYPIRFWDHDIGPDFPRLLHTRIEVSSGAAATGELRDLTPSAGLNLAETSATLSPDGTTIVTTWRRTLGSGDEQSVLAAIDVETGEHTLIFDDGEADSPTLSPDGGLVAFIHTTIPDPHTAPRVSLWVARPDGSSARNLTADWPLWPSSIAWLPDSSGLVVTADADGRGPVFLISIGGDIRQVTTTDSAYSNVVVCPNGEVIYAVQTSYLYPADIVRIDISSGEVTELKVPFPRPDLPGELRDVETIANDGQRIRSWLAIPHGATAKEPAPLLVWIHGGPLGSWNSWSWRWNPWIAVAQGYAVLLPDPGLSTGYGQEFIQRGWGDWGGAPYTDLMSATDAAVELAEIDETRTAAMGGSFGGYMANWVAGHTDRFKAIVTHASLWNLHTFGPTTDAAFYWAKEMTPDMVAANSPHAHVANIVTPMLVIHGDKDYRVPIGEGLALWYQLLAESGVRASEDGTTDHRFLYFPTENHWVLTPQHAKVWYEVILGFLGEHVLELDQPATPSVLGQASSPS